MHATEVPAARPGIAHPTRLALAAALAAALFWVVMLEGGPVPTVLSQSGPFLHELFHDGRHLVGVPCH